MKTYRDEEPYRLLKESYKLFKTAQDKFDFKDIGEKNGIPNTVWALVMLSFRLGQLCESILACKELYVAAIVFRALIEHFFKHSYFCMYCSIQENDNIAKEYVSPEHLSSEMWKKLQKIIWPNCLSSKSKLKNLKEIGEKQQKNFEFNKVLNSLLKLMEGDRTKKELDKFDEIKNTSSESSDYEKLLRDYGIKYSISSSYVHAGPRAVLEIKEPQVQRQEKEEIEMQSVFLTLMSYIFIMRLLSTYSIEHKEELKVLYEKIEENADNIFTHHENKKEI